MFCSASVFISTNSKKQLLSLLNIKPEKLHFPAKNKTKQEHVDCWIKLSRPFAEMLECEMKRQKGHELHRSCHHTSIYFRGWKVKMQSLIRCTQKTWPIIKEIHRSQQRHRILKIWEIKNSPEKAAYFLSEGYKGRNQEKYKQAYIRRMQQQPRQ